MTKEQLQNELDNYKRLYETLKIEYENLLKEKEDIEIYKDLNLQLQLEVKKLEKEKDELERLNDNLSTECRTYKEVHDILTKVVGDKRC
jgi:FtsZ-binding cell division protein ZapB